MLRNAAANELGVRPCPRHRALEPLAQRHLDAEAELALRLCRIAVALAGVVPVPARPHLDAAFAARDGEDFLGKLADRGLDAARKVVDVAGLAAQCAGGEAARNVLHIDEVARA